MVNLISPAAATRMTNNLAGAQGQDPAERDIVMGPQHVAPAVTYLCSPQCTESGLCIDAAGGHFGRIAIVRNTGVPMTDAAITQEDVAIPWPMCIYIQSLTNGRLKQAAVAPATNGRVKHEV